MHSKKTKKYPSTVDYSMGCGDNTSTNTDSYNMISKERYPTVGTESSTRGTDYTKFGITPHSLQCAPQPKEALSTIVFLLHDNAGRSQAERIKSLLETYIASTVNGYNIRDLSEIVYILDHMIDGSIEFPSLLEAMLENAFWPVSVTANSDIETKVDHLAEYYNFLGYLLAQLHDDHLFGLVYTAICNQLQAPTKPNSGMVPLRIRKSAVHDTTIVTMAVRMIALCKPERFESFLRLTLLLTTISRDICVEMLKDNILDNILYRFNPYFPENILPIYDINPKYPLDYRVRVGDSCAHIDLVLSIFSILSYYLKILKDTAPETFSIECPDAYAQRCWMWALRYECRTSERKHERNTFISITMILLHCFGDELEMLGSHFMCDILSLAVKTEVPVKNGWLSDVAFSPIQIDAHFKKLLIHCSVQFLKIFPSNATSLEVDVWILGLMYFIDPCLYTLRFKWSKPLFAELRITALQALVVAIPLCPQHLSKKYGLIRRLLWYIEWYTVFPFDTKLLYWNLRLIKAANGLRASSQRSDALEEMSDSHALVVIVRLSYCILDQKDPPIERNQAILALCLRLLTSAVESQKSVFCVAYPFIHWPASGFTLGKIMLDSVYRALNGNLIVSSRLIVTLFNFIWESIIWKKEYRIGFIAENGIYKILDVISMSGESAQCIGLALLCETALVGEGIAHLLTWRARPSAGSRCDSLVTRGARLPELLAAIAHDECIKNGVKINRETGVIEDLNSPVMGEWDGAEMEKIFELEPYASMVPRSIFCFAASRLAGSRMSKVSSILQVLMNDLNGKVDIADEAYKMYKDITISAKDRVVLTLCAHFEVCKMGEVWTEVDELTKASCRYLLFGDQLMVDEFKLLYKGWAHEIQYLQEEICANQSTMENKAEQSLYTLLSKCRLTTALDSLKKLRTSVRCSMPGFLALSRLQDAVAVHHIRIQEKALPIIKTYVPEIDDTNVIGRDKKILTIPKKSKYTKTKNPPGSTT